MLVWILGEAPTKGPLKGGATRNRTKPTVHCGRDNEHFVDLATKMGMFLKPVYTLMQQTQTKMFKNIFTSHDGPQITTEVTSYNQRRITILAHRWIIFLLVPPVVQFVSAARVARVFFVTVFILFDSGLSQQILNQLNGKGVGGGLSTR